MDRLTKLLETVLDLWEALGPWWTLAFLLVLTGGPFLIGWLRDRKLEKLYREIIDTKEAEIGRLAADNKEFRRLLFKDLGAPELEPGDVPPTQLPPPKPAAKKKGKG